MKMAMTNEQQRRIVVEEIWLRYFNDTLLQKGLITQQEHQKMILKIQEETERKKKRATGKTSCA